MIWIDLNQCERQSRQIWGWCRWERSWLGLVWWCIYQHYITKLAGKTVEMRNLVTIPEYLSMLAIYNYIYRLHSTKGIVCSYWFKSSSEYIHFGGLLWILYGYVPSCQPNYSTPYRKLISDSWSKSARILCMSKTYCRLVNAYVRIIIDLIPSIQRVTTFIKSSGVTSVHRYSMRIPWADIRQYWYEGGKMLWSEVIEIYHDYWTLQSQLGHRISCFLISLCLIFNDLSYWWILDWCHFSTLWPRLRVPILVQHHVVHSSCLRSWCVVATSNVYIIETRGNRRRNTRDRIRAWKFAVIGAIFRGQYLFTLYKAFWFIQEPLVVTIE